MTRLPHQTVQTRSNNAVASNLESHKVVDKEKNCLRCIHSCPFQQGVLMCMCTRSKRYREPTIASKGGDCELFEKAW